jgi:hypothetical protein
MNTSNRFLDKQRAIGDAVADQLFNDIRESNQLANLHAALALTEQGLRRLEEGHCAKTFLLGKRSDPKWYDERRILRGQRIFETHAVQIMTLLGVMSLPYCYAASPGNKALFMAEKMRQNPAKRLTDTAQFTIDVLTPGNLQLGKNGSVQIRKTRIIHAMARHYIGQAAWNPVWGMPINQEDMAGTNLAFSYITLLGLQSSGVILSVKEKEDFLFTWRYIGFQLGIDERLLPGNFKDAEILTTSIKRRHFEKTDEGIILTRELVKYLESVVPPRQASFVQAQMKYFLGREVAGFLGLPNDSIKDKIVELANSVKEIQNMFTIPKSSLPVLLSDFEGFAK